MVCYSPLPVLWEGDSISVPIFTKYWNYIQFCFVFDRAERATFGLPLALATWLVCLSYPWKAYQESWFSLPFLPVTIPVFGHIQNAIIMMCRNIFSNFTLSFEYYWLLNLHNSLFIITPTFLFSYFISTSPLIYKCCSNPYSFHVFWCLHHLSSPNQQAEFFSK